MFSLHPARTPVLITLISVLSIGTLVFWLAQFETLPDFKHYTDVAAKKQAFFTYLRPKVNRVNRDILADRASLLDIQLITGQPLPWWQRVKLVRIARDYGIEPDAQMSDTQLMHEALLRANEIPISLALIQAAKESGWGTSKFARLANNLFGQQCFVPGCGIVPATRARGPRHEVERFRTVQDAVAGYAYNLNSHPRYTELRAIRARLSNTQQPISGIALAEGLLAYSERGQAYVREVQSMIRQNNLE